MLTIVNKQVSYTKYVRFVYPRKMIIAKKTSHDTTRIAGNSNRRLAELKAWAQSQYGQGHEHMPLAEVEMTRDEIMQMFHPSTK
ncbi:hypothetical protein [Alysiella filiformis]|uniref:Uncharacterized protein n=1 Tax=Alysiella filiformis DSM 16848 TaxID=1120981 RepID=A0A286EFQ9_9NEIS|nr:hypothetical protein [Alysiella filiformis]QMT30499.1 hypothetical protein H3L97_06975 [Alysiella filiformis]UBQ56520.1 hypothetical protein JF568_01705 [Alysiella filiformis DSM 16848]SOD69737.1 hypothetical protein SAMN02746062_01813 [Alysiella filiformis DSM 16848]